MEIYVDASYGSSNCNSLPQGGIGIVNKNEYQAIAISVTGQNLTTIRLEALAIFYALIVYSDRKNIVIYTDNQHCYESLVTLKTSYVQNDWKRINGQHVAELDILLQCEYLITARQNKNHKTKIKKIVSHSGNLYHDTADRLAYKAMTNNTKELPIAIKLNSSNNSKNPISSIRESMKYNLSISTNDITQQLKPFGIQVISEYLTSNSIVNNKISSKNNNNIDILESSIQTVPIRDTFLLCVSCGEIILIRNMDTSIHIIKVTSITYFTQCRICDNNYGKINEPSKDNEIINIIFPDSDANKLINTISAYNTDLNINTLRAGYKHRDLLLNRYLSNYAILSLDRSTNQCLKYLKSGFF